MSVGGHTTREGRGVQLAPPVSCRAGVGGGGGQNIKSKPGWGGEAKKRQGFGGRGANKEGRKQSKKTMSGRKINA